MNLLSIGANPKLAKSDAGGEYLTAGHTMAPHKSVPGHNACPGASPACIRDCLRYAGRGVMAPVHAARVRKSELYFSDPGKYALMISQELVTLQKRAKKNKKLLASRLNVLSDVDWSKVIAKHPDIQFYDYTKVEDRIMAYARGELPKNYYLTLSRSEVNEDFCRVALRKGWANVAVVFRVKKGHALPKTWWGYPVIDGDKHDLRFTDPKHVVVGLRAKGRAMKDRSGFVVDTEGNA